MKLTSTRLFVASCAVAFLATAAGAQMTAYDGFGGGTRPDLHGFSGGQGWSGPWQDSGSAITTSIVASGLSYPGLALTPGAATTPGGFLPDMTRYVRDFPAVPGNSMYVSFLIRPEPAYSNWHTLRFGLYPYQVDVGLPIGYYNYGLMLGDGLITVSNVPAVPGQTIMLVLEVVVEPTVPRTGYALYVNPTVGSPKPSFANTSFARGAAIPLRGGLELLGEGGYTIDELRIGSTWESVLPAACYANCDGSVAAPILNVNDFTCFLNRFAAGDPYANCDGSTAVPVLNVNDFTCFLNSYATGCP